MNGLTFYKELKRAQSIFFRHTISEHRYSTRYGFVQTPTIFLKDGEYIESLITGYKFYRMGVMRSIKLAIGLISHQNVMCEMPNNMYWFIKS